MKILFSSHFFAPSVGGIESVSKILAEKFASAGHEVHVITQSPGGDIPDANYSLTRKPPFSELRSLLRWCDLLFQNNISLRNLLPALFLKKKVIVVHQTWLQDTRGKITWNNRIKRSLLRFVTNVAISNAVADRLGEPSFVIGNPYDDIRFRAVHGMSRDKTIVFVGRLVSDKGVDLLLQALQLLQADGLSPDLTIVGDGPEENNLRALSRTLSLDRQVTFIGQKSGEELAQILNQHRILAVPSRWAEPFGIVALEGIACGCVVVGSQEGGLKEAIGPCGLTFPNGNTRGLADRLKELLTRPELAAELTSYAEEHLARFKSGAIAATYLSLMQKLLV